MTTDSLYCEYSDAVLKVRFICYSYLEVRLLIEDVEMSRNECERCVHNRHSPRFRRFASLSRFSCS